MAFGQITVTNTAVQVPTNNGTVTLQNNGAVAVAVGTAATVTVATGVLIQPGGAGTFDGGQDVWVITTTTADVRWISSA